MKKITSSNQFKAKLLEYKQLLDEDIVAYADRVRRTTLQQYGAGAREVTDAYLEILNRGGKRIRGALTLVGYEMCGGTDQQMILQAARAIEMIHAYILIIDDIQDRSPVRRGGPSAHRLLGDYHHKHELAGDSQHYGEAQAINAALSGNHAAQMILANLAAPEDLRLAVLSIMNRTMMVTAHGQTYDLLNQVSAEVSEESVDRVLEWKTAVYTFLNPLHVGMVLAGADCRATDAITPFAINVGKAFQIRDDNTGTFGTEEAIGKSPMDDIREGKQTLMIVYALQHADNTDRNFLLQSLGNQKLTSPQFERCKRILMDCGAYEYAKKLADDYIDAAILSLQNETIAGWKKANVQFLHDLAKSLK